jgi:hypothetical protein
VPWGEVPLAPACLACAASLRLEGRRGQARPSAGFFGGAEVLLAPRDGKDGNHAPAGLCRQLFRQPHLSSSNVGRPL